MRLLFPLLSLPRPVRVGLSLFFLAGLADGVMVPFFGLWCRQDGAVPTALIGLLFACYAGGELVAAPFVGGIADRIGRRPVLLLSCIGVGGSFLLLPCVHGVMPVAMVLLLIGLFESVLHPTIASVIADVAADATVDRRSASSARTLYAAARMAGGAGHAVGPALGAMLAAHRLGAVFVCSGLAMLSGAVLVAGLLPETLSRGHVDDDEEEDELGALLLPFRDRRLAALILPVAVLGISASWLEAVLPLYAAGARTLTSTGIGLLFSAAGFLSVVCQLPLATWSNGRSGFTIVRLAGVLLAVAFALLSCTAAVPALVLAVIASGFAGMLSGPLVQSVVAEMAPATGRARYMAAFSATQDLQDAAGPAIGTALFAAMSILPWLVGLPVALAASLVLAKALHRHEVRAAPTWGRTGG